MEVIDRFKYELEKAGKTECALILSPHNRLYLTSFSSSDGAVLITKRNAYLIVDFRYYEMALNKHLGLEVVLCDGSILSKAYELAQKEGISNVSIEDEFVTVATETRIKQIFNGYNVTYLGDILTRMRAVKTESEIERIKASQSITDSAFSHIVEVLGPNMTENDVAAELEYFFKKEGAEASFKTIAVSGKKSSLPHGEPGDVRLTRNSFLTMDFGARLDGYCSDMTRTVVIGRADEDMKRIYNIVLEAQKSALNTIKEDVTGEAVDKAARSIISDNGYGNYFGHATGHGLGIEVHEKPSFSPKYNFEIPANSVLSVEPGIYLEGKYGVRIEDIVVVKTDNAINLTQSSKNLIEL